MHSLCTWTHCENEGKVISEMAYMVGFCVMLFPLNRELACSIAQDNGSKKCRFHEREKILGAGAEIRTEPLHCTLYCFVSSLVSESLD